jgi:hypothetical protein
MKRIPQVVAILSSLLISSLSHAAGIGVGAKAGTLGLGIEITKGITAALNGRIGFNSYTFDASGTESDIDYNSDFKLQTVAALVDWHPFHGGLRATAGVMANNNKLDMTGKTTGNVDIGGVVYTPAQVGNLNGNVSFDNIAPYLGIGWGNAVEQGQRLTFSFEVGVLMQGSPKVDLTSSGGTLSTDPTFQANLATEQAQLEDDLSDYDLYPVVSLGMAYQF